MRDRAFTGRELRPILDVAASAGVTGQIFLPTPNEARFRNQAEGMDGVRRLVEMAPDRVAMLCGSDYLTVWMHEAFQNGYSARDLGERLARLRADLDQGGCLGIGEIGPYHFEKSPGQRVLTFPMNFTPLLKIAELAAQKIVPLEIHAEPVTPEDRSFEDEVFGGIELLFRLNPSLRLILSHTAMTHPSNARALLGKYPNLSMNLKVPPARLSWVNLGKVTSASDELFEDWALLMEEMPGRFMVGMDNHFYRSRRGSRGFRAKRYRRRVQQMRRILGGLAPPAQQPIAFKNAEKMWPRLKARSGR